MFQLKYPRSNVTVVVCIRAVHSENTAALRTYTVRYESFMDRLCIVFNRTPSSSFTTVSVRCCIQWSHGLNQTTELHYLRTTYVMFSCHICLQIAPTHVVRAILKVTAFTLSMSTIFCVKECL